MVLKYSKNIIKEIGKPGGGTRGTRGTVLLVCYINSHSLSIKRMDLWHNICQSPFLHIRGDNNRVRYVLLNPPSEQFLDITFMENKMEQLILKFSNDTIKERKKLIYWMTGIMIPLMIAIAYFVASMKGVTKIKLMIIIIAVTVPLLVAEMFIVSSIMFKKLAELTLILGDTSLKRRGGNHAEEISYSEIKHVTVKRNKRGRILFVKIGADAKTINLAGFDNMETALLHIQNNVPETVIPDSKQYKTDWNSPIIIALSMVFTAVVLLVLMKKSYNIYNIINILIPLCISVVFLIYKPISRNAGQRFRKFEIIISIILIICTVIMIISHIFE